MIRGPRIGSDRRGASEVLGAMFVFAILVAAVGMFQVTIVPQTNEEIEFKHSNQVRGQMQELRSSMVAVGTDGTSRSVSVRTGTNYPTWAVAVNPGDPGGTLATESVSGAVKLDGLEATDDEADDYWTGEEKEFDSAHVSYRPAYNYYANAPETRYEPTVLYSTFRDGQVLESQQSLISGRTLNLVLVEGDLSQGGSAQTVDVNPVSTATRTIPLETDGGSGRLEVRTELKKPEWEELLASNPHASLHSDSTFNDDAPSTAVIELDDGQWRLRASVVSLNRPSTDPPAEYIVVEGSTERLLNSGESTDVTVRALDRYGNPVEGVTVERDFGTARETGEDGTVTYEYSLPSASGTTLEMWIDDAEDADPDSDPKKVSVAISTSSSDTGSPDASLINPGSGLVFSGAYAADNDVTLSFENRGDDEVTVTDMRVNYYHMGPPGSGQSQNSRDKIEKWSSNVTTGPKKSIAGDFYQTDGSFVVASEEDIRVEMSFYDESNDHTDVASNDFYILSLVFEDGTSRIYFVAAQD